MDKLYVYYAINEINKELGTHEVDSKSDFEEVEQFIKDNPQNKYIIDVYVVNESDKPVTVNDKTIVPSDELIVGTIHLSADNI